MESFVVRLFAGDDAELRGEVVHVRTGERRTFRTGSELEAALRGSMAANPFHASAGDDER